MERRIEVTSETLNSAVEFDCEFRVNEDLTVDYLPEGVDAPESVEVYVDRDGQIVKLPDGGDIDKNGWDGWDTVTGFSGQDRYSGPIMHRSETLSGGMSRWVLETPGLYVVKSVECSPWWDATDEEIDEVRSGEPAGWVLLTKPL